MTLTVSTPVAASLLVAHRAELTCLGEAQFELRYPVAVTSFSERVANVIEVVFPIAATSEPDALEIAAIVLGGHKPPELTPPPVAEEVTLPRAGYHRQYVDG